MILGTTNGLVSFNAMVHIWEERVVTLTGFYCDGVELIPFSHKETSPRQSPRRKKYTCTRNNIHLN